MLQRLGGGWDDCPEAHEVGHVGGLQGGWRPAGVASQAESLGGGLGLIPKEELVTPRQGREWEGCLRLSARAHLGNMAPEA